MRRFLLLPLLFLFLLGMVPLGSAAWAASKAHVLSFGKWTAVKFSADADDGNTVELKMRPLYLDARLKEFTLGPPHEITDRLFVVRRAFRLNDTLPQETATAPRWLWQRGGWLLVDRMTGHISAIALPEFDAADSAASWYRDYAAYCGVSDDGKKTFAIVAQLGRRKPILKQSLNEARTEDEPACAAPTWQRQPMRVAFTPGDGKAFSYSIRGHAVDLVTEDAEQEEGAQ